MLENKNAVELCKRRSYYTTRYLQIPPGGWLQQMAPKTALTHQDRFWAFINQVCIDHFTPVFCIHKAMLPVIVKVHLSMHGCYIYSGTAAKLNMCYSSVKNLCSANLHKCPQHVYTSLAKDSYGLIVCWRLCCVEGWLCSMKSKRIQDSFLGDWE